MSDRERGKQEVDLKGGPLCVVYFLLVGNFFVSLPLLSLWVGGVDGGFCWFLVLVLLFWEVVRLWRENESEEWPRERERERKIQQPAAARQARKRRELVYESALHTGRVPLRTHTRGGKIWIFLFIKIGAFRFSTILISD